MICTRCLRLMRRPGGARPPRFAARATPTPPPTRRNASNAAATQPFTVPPAMSPSGVDAAAAATADSAGEHSPAAAVALSSVPGGTVLRGLNIYRDKQDPVAMEDAEYPQWLWKVLELRGADGEASPDELLSKRPTTSRPGEYTLTVPGRQNDQEAGQES
jgi:large subunit ribosomal protein L54